MLKGEGCYTWAWSRGGERSGSIGVRVDSTMAVTLQYTATINGSRQDLNERVAIEQVPCNFGGVRPWFCCTRCARRVAVLYLRGGRFACRSCQRVAYTSQSGSVSDRVHARYHKLHALIENGKPKWRRWATFNRMVDKFELADERANLELLRVIQRLTGHKQ
jgi:hypothetical protein